MSILTLTRDMAVNPALFDLTLHVWRNRMRATVTKRDQAGRFSR
ncbi:hypothetical protein SAMN02927924_01415 [Sphingobium faniae]|nr:hypothetical protein SAMN02927924_01415 [Sphingobium faniae]